MFSKLSHPLADFALRLDLIEQREQFSMKDRKKRIQTLIPSSFQRNKLKILQHQKFLMSLMI